MKYAKRLSLLVSVVLILMTDIKLIQYVESFHVSNYIVVPKYTSEVIIENKQYEFEFESVGKEMLYLEAAGACEEDCIGKVSYQLLDDSDSVIFESGYRNVEEVRNIDSNRWHFDISGAPLEHGKTYLFTVKFELNGEAYIQTDAQNGRLVMAQYFYFNYQWLLITLIIVLNILFAGFMIWFLKEGLTNRLFVVVAITTGLAFALLTPPASQDDEYRHFVRAYDIAQGNLHAELYEPVGNEKGMTIPLGNNQLALVEVPEEINTIRLLATGNIDDNSYQSEVNNNLSVNKIMGILSNPEQEGTQRVSDIVCIYKGLWDYWPQTLFIVIGRLLHIRSLLIYYLARIGQMLACVLLAWLALKLVPEYKNLIWLSYFVPNEMILRSSNNPDGLMFAECLLLLAIILHMRKNRIKVLSLPWTPIFLLLLFSVFKMKAPYAIMCAGFVLLLKQDNFRIKIRYIISTCLIVVVIGLMGLILTGNIIPFVLKMAQGYLPEEHVHYAIENFQTVIPMWLLKMKDLSIETLHAMKGQFYIPYLLVFVVALAFCMRREKMWEKAYGCVLIIGMLFMIVLAGYSMSLPYLGKIIGISYRYMLPVIPVLAYILPMGNKNSEMIVEKIYPIYLFPIVLGNLLQSFIGLMS